ncbi:phage antirepressor KilAC domain-containing protein [Streptococcus equi subsp. zooepidemicus]|uniref:BRO family protein n=1 Tax=Streptococcus equi TaxID=1336 RepID=UPI0005B810CF|nr:BRO family protein [Streptococcus equi]KIS13219.1 phage associated antirepressor [Streptococcus equi subsp. zooepidemicus Sz105]QBX15630.1 putative antirepressor [Streptococcus phage Javan197]MCD3410375.1 phage antirepressor KilAC domain-containing protein [Streptococcus equi subsp. zooepidemicus]MCD3410655.1 phage antirepressor KilAC domain-containing protein [Streptococcus equi subsp. zooepidemicus]MCD3452876.1 phage antirepressor KilAC domain-containing protein [Streptococcus equi subsp.
MELQIFKNEQFGEVRTATINNQIYFNLNDCCQILELSNPRKTIERLNKDGVTTSDIIDSLGRTQQANFINESNFYKLVFQSRKPEAEKFADWVTSEVLPSIRKRGVYMTDKVAYDITHDKQALGDLLLMAGQQLKEKDVIIKGLEAETSRLTVEKAIMQPKADYFDELVDRNLLTSFRETAKQFKVKERQFIQFLLDKKYIYRDRKGKLMPFADKNNGLFEVKESVNEKTNWSGTQTLITPKGRETFRLLFI